MIGPVARGRLGSRLSRRPYDERLHALPSRPVISVVMPAYETDPGYLKAAIDSVREQAYPDWELCIANDGSRSRRVRRVIDARAAADTRIRAVHLKQNAGISAASNAALELASGDYVAFLDHDDELTPDALLAATEALTADPALDVVYSDSDKLDLFGRRVDPFLKPDWAPVYALGAMYIGHLLVVRRSLVTEVGGFDPAFDTIQDFELMLRISERTDRIRHLPQILYHWRAIPGSIAAGAEEKSGVPELQAAAVSAHLSRTGTAARAVPHPSIPHRARLAALPDSPPAIGSVNAVIAWRGDQRRLDRLTAALARAGLGSGQIVVVEPEPHFSRARAANLGAAQCSADSLLFLADAVEPQSEDWLEQLLLHLLLRGVAAAGPLLAHPDGRAAAAGTALGLSEPAMPMLSGLEVDDDGYYGSLACSRDVSALSGDCLLVGAAEFAAAGGFDEAFLTGFEDFDLCQRLAAAGHRLAYVAGATVIDHEPPAVRREALDIIDRALFVDRWYPQLERGDPYFNPGFDRESASFKPAVEAVA
jgi:GT2 family glycosyltransferase